MVQRVYIKRTPTNNNPPADNSLSPGELFVEMGAPLRLWVGVSTSIIASGKKLLLSSAAIVTSVNGAIGDVTITPAGIGAVPAAGGTITGALEVNGALTKGGTAVSLSGHTHTIANVTGLQTALDGKAASSHTHAQSDITGLVTALAGKAATSHTHAQSDITNLVTDLAGKAAASHTHAQSDITGLVAALAGKAATSHTHTIADVTGLQTALDAKVALSDVVGKQTIGIEAGGMLARTTNGAAYAKEELATNDVMVDYWAFDPTTSEAVQSRVRMPKGWNEGTVEVEFRWKHPATTVNFGVKWGVRARAFSDNEALDAAWGTAVEVADTGGTTGNLYKSAFTAALTIGGTPAEGDLVIFEFYRAPADASDTMAVDAHLMGVSILYTTNAAKDD